jgi:hypothetical protein
LLRARCVGKVADKIVKQACIDIFGTNLQRLRRYAQHSDPADPNQPPMVC